MGLIAPRQDHLDYDPRDNLDQQYNLEKKEEETYEEWVRRKSDQETVKFFIFLLVAPPIALILTALIEVLFG